MNIHPTIGDDEIDVWLACRQLMLPGARVEVTNYSWQSVKRDAFDSLYHRGLANRQGNGETGKYEMFIYTPTEKLLAWARQQDLLRASFDDVLKGRDVKNELRNLRRRARYAEQRDRARYFADTSTTDLYVGRHPRPDEASRELAIVKNPPSTEAYVAAWCRLNRLKT